MLKRQCWVACLMASDTDFDAGTCFHKNYSYDALILLISGARIALSVRPLSIGGQ